MNDAKPPNRLIWLRSVLDEFEGPLLRYATRITGDTERARDVVQDSFLRLCRENPAELDGRVAQWLFAVCRNKALDVCRKEGRMQALTDRQTTDRESHDRDPATAAQHRETGNRVLRLLAELPDNQQEVVRLRFQNALSYKDIAAVTGLSMSNVGYLIHVAIAKLREQLKDE